MTRKKVGMALGAAASAIGEALLASHASDYARDRVGSTSGVEPAPAVSR